MSDREQPIPRSFSRRAAKVTSAFTAQSARHAGTRALNLLRRDDERAAELLEQRHIEAAQRAAEVLGSMKGGAMKVGQLASFVQLEFVPPEYRELYEAELAKLRDSAPPMDWRAVERVLKAEWGAPVASIVADVDTEHPAAASIGQVHRARLTDGREVALKVQYPEIADALAVDVQTAGVLVRFARAIAPGLDAQAAAGELRERILEELDYELEAQHQRAFARAYRGHPFVRVPEVDTDLSRRRVLVSEWMDGRRFEEVRALPQAERDSFGEMFMRFYFGAIDVLGRFNADPHPGNYLLRDDGVAFLDYGSCKVMSREYRAGQLELIRAVVDGDVFRVRDGFARLGFLNDPARTDPELLMRRTVQAIGWIVVDRELRIDAEFISRTIRDALDSVPEYYKDMRRENLPPDEIMFRRLDTSVVAVLAQLEATRNWHRIAREWWYGDEPQTELGRAEREFFRGRPLWRDPRAA